MDSWKVSVGSAQRGHSAVPAGRDLLQRVFSGSVLAGLHRGKADEVLRQLAGLGQAVLAGDGRKLFVGLNGAGFGIREGLGTRSQLLR